MLKCWKARNNKLKKKRLCRVERKPNFLVAKLWKFHLVAFTFSCHKQKRENNKRMKTTGWENVCFFPRKLCNEFVQNYAGKAFLNKLFRQRNKIERVVLERVQLKKI